MKKIFTFLLLMSIIIFNINLSYSALENGNIETITYKISDKNMYVNGVAKEIDPGRTTTPIIYNERALLPIRSFIEALGGTTNWIEEEKLIILNLNSKEIKLWLNKKTAYVNNKMFTLDVPPIISNSRTVVPIRFVSENLGYYVTWNENDKSILINTSNQNNSKTTNTNTTEYSIYTVSQSETLWSISQKFNMSIESIKEINNLGSEIIYTGQKLKIPSSNISISDSSNTNSNNSNNFTNENIIETVLNSNDKLFKTIVQNKDTYEIQILFTKIERDINNNPNFTTYEYNVNENNYFYPASSVKLAASILALEKLNNLNITGLEKTTSMHISSYRNMPSKKGTVESYIKKSLLYSDNSSFDSLYEFLGQEYFNNTLWNKGLNKSLILHRLGNYLTYEENRYTNPVTFVKNGLTLYSQEAKYNATSYSNLGLNKIYKGNGYYSSKGTVWNPKDFSHKNYMSVVVLQNIVKSLIFPNYVPNNQRFNLSNNDRYFIMNNMRDSNIETKFFICGAKNSLPAGTQVFNKSGIAYGHTIDNAYIVNKNLGVEFLLTAVIYTNKNKILGDNIYEYYTVGIPFLKNLSNSLFDYLKTH